MFLTLFPPAFYSNPLYPYCRWRLSPLTSQCHQGPARQGVVKHFLSGKRRPHSYAWSLMKLTATERDRLDECARVPANTATCAKMLGCTEMRQDLCGSTALNVSAIG